MDDRHFDVGIIGGGIAGAFAALKLAETHKNIKTILFEYGRAPQKRRRFLEGWFGCFPTGDGKIYENDLNKILNVADGRRTKTAHKWFFNHLNHVDKVKLTKNKQPSTQTQKRIKEAGFSLLIDDYYQWKPDSIHQLSKHVADKIEDGGNITFSFDNEVYTILKQKKNFLISSAEGDYYCKKVILCVGRSGWRWVNKLYKDLGILCSDNHALYGVRVELPAQYMKEFNKSHCSFYNDNLTVGPLSWAGSVIQEDHADLTISAFRSNEERWKTDKVFFSLTGKQYFENAGTKQTDRLAKLAFLLSGDRVGREKIKDLIKGSTQLNLIPEFSWIPEKLESLITIVPQIINRGYFHYPDIVTMTSKININSNLETEIEGLFVAGESAGVSGIAAAGIMGALAAESVCK